MMEAMVGIWLEENAAANNTLQRKRISWPALRAHKSCARAGPEFAWCQSSELGG